MFRLILAGVSICASTALHAQANTPAAQPLPRTTFIATMDGEFRKIDANRDGQLTRAEIENGQRAQAQAQAQLRARTLFRLLDTDRNGSISAAEFTKLPITQARVDASALLSFDTSRDGKVSLVEHRTATLANFDRLDADKDGIVSVNEMKALPRR